jgi:nicotinamidase-related amidase
MSEPEDVDPMLLAAIQKINATVAFTMVTETTNAITSRLTPGQTELILPDGSQVQVVDSYADIAGPQSYLVKKHQYSAFIREERLLLVWNDDLNAILSHAADLEGKLLSLVSNRNEICTSPVVDHTRFGEVRLRCSTTQ